MCETWACRSAQRCFGSCECLLSTFMLHLFRSANAYDGMDAYHLSIPYSNFVVAITFPRLLGAFRPQGAFGWYAAWNVVGFVLILLFVPETKALSLEELDQVFSVPTRTHAAYQIKALPRNIKKYLFRMKVEDVEPLYQHEKLQKEEAENGQVRKRHFAPVGAV